MQSLRGIYAPFQRGFAAYNTYLQKNYPTIYELQNAVLHGSKTTMVDTKDYVVAASRNMQEKPLSYKELTLRWTYPGDLLKLTPVALFLMLPFSTVALIPVIYYFPHTFFTRNFWTAGQRKRFDSEEVTRRFEAVPNVIAHFEQNIPRSGSVEDRYLLQDVLHQIKKNHVVPEEQILDLRPIFAQYPFSMFSMPPEYVNDLAQLNGMSARKVQKFPSHLVLMDHALDEKLRNSKGDLSDEQIRHAALLRGFDPNLSLDECAKFLAKWTHTSSSLLGPAESLLLHFPIFLSYPSVFNRENRAHMQSK